MSQRICDAGDVLQPRRRRSYGSTPFRAAPAARSSDGTTPPCQRHRLILNSSRISDATSFCRMQHHPAERGRQALSASFFGLEDAILSDGGNSSFPNCAPQQAGGSLLYGARRSGGMILRYSLGGPAVAACTASCVVSRRLPPPVLSMGGSPYSRRRTSMRTLRMLATAKECKRGISSPRLGWFMGIRRGQRVMSPIEQCAAR